MDQAFPRKTVAGTSHLFPAKALVATRPTENSGTVAIVIVLLAVATNLELRTRAGELPHQ